MHVSNLLSATQIRGSRVSSNGVQYWIGVRGRACRRSGSLGQHERQQTQDGDGAENSLHCDVYFDIFRNVVLAEHNI